MPQRVPVTWPLGVLAERSGLGTWVTVALIISPLPKPRTLGAQSNETHSILPLLQSFVSGVIPHTVGGICPPPPGSEKNVFQPGAELAL